MKETKEAVKTVSQLLKEAANQAEVKGMIDLAERERRIIDGLVDVAGRIKLSDAINALYGVLYKWETDVDIHSPSVEIYERLASIKHAYSFISLAISRLEHDDEVLNCIVKTIYSEKEELKKLTG